MGSETSKVAEDEVGISQDFRGLTRRDNSYLNEELSDFKVIVKLASGTWRYPCHKFVLRQEKSLFAKHCELCNSTEMFITDTEPEYVEMVLRYIYEKEILLDDWKTACEVWNAAHKYNVKSLVEKCEAFLLKSLTLRNVCVILEVSEMYSSENLKRSCLELCKMAAFVVLRTQAFASLPEALVKTIVEMDGLNVGNEFALFQALWNWSKMQCVCENFPLDEKFICQKFSNVADFVKFECMTTKQKELLPEYIKSRYSKSLQPDAPCDSKNCRSIKFPLDLKQDFYFSLMFEPKQNPVGKNSISGTIICGMKFGVKLDAYLVSFTTLCLKGASSSRIKELILSSSAGILVSWKENSENDVKKMSSKERRFSVDDDVMVSETEFCAVRALPLHVGVEYSLEITPDYKEVEWPQTVAVIDKKKSNLDVFLSSSLTCGLRKITFLQGK